MVLHSEVVTFTPQDSMARLAQAQVSLFRAWLDLLTVTTRLLRP